MAVIRLIGISLLTGLLLTCDVLTEKPVRNNPNDPGVTTAASPVFTPPAGNYSVAQSVTLASITPDATIRYTTDGSVPSATTGTVYTAAIAVGTSTTLKAVAHRTGLDDSPPVTALYTFTVLTDKEAVAADKASLAIGFAAGDSAAGVTQDVTLPTTGPNGSTIQWMSDNNAVVSIWSAPVGIVTRPTVGTVVMLSATIQRGYSADTRSFSITVMADLPVANDWTMVDMGLASTRNLGKVAVGAGRSDGKIRVYAGETGFGSGKIYEHIHAAGSWTIVPISGFGNTEVRGLVTADVRNNGTPGVYATGYGLAEWLYAEPAWSGGTLNVTIDNDIQWVGGGGLAVGTRAKETYRRIYIPDGQNRIDEISYDFGLWDAVAIPTGSAVNDLVVAPGHNDNDSRLYAVLGTFGGKIYEYAWNANTTSWALSVCVTEALSTSFHLVRAGAGRNDGVQRIYGWGEAGLYEFSWNAGTQAWTYVRVSSAAYTDVSSTNDAFTLADGRNDGMIRLYTADANGIGEYTGTASGSWSKTALIRSTAAVGIAVGNGRNDDPSRNRIYVTAGAHVYEYTAP